MNKAIMGRAYCGLRRKEKRSKPGYFFLGIVTVSFLIPAVILFFKYSGAAVDPNLVRSEFLTNACASYSTLRYSFSSRSNFILSTSFSFFISLSTSEVTCSIRSLFINADSLVYLSGINPFLRILFPEHICVNVHITFFLPCVILTLQYLSDNQQNRQSLHM